MNGDSSRMIAEIRAAINKGTLTHSEIERRLDTVIAAETDKEDSPADMELIRACQSLLWELDTHGQEELADDTEQSLAAFKAKKAAYAKGKRFIFRTVAAAAAVLVMGFGIDALLHHEWLQGDSTSDEQQYVVTGHEIDPDTMNEGKADGDAMPAHDITTTELDEAIDALGFMPLVPSWLPDGWQPKDYYVLVSPAINAFRVSYTKADSEQLLRYSISQYPDMDAANTEFEQSSTGTEVQCGAYNVYISTNTDRYVAVWRDGVFCYNLSGAVTKDELTRTILSIKKE